MEPSDSDAVEISPDRRYIRYNEILGRGASKIVYKGFDEIDGIEVAWNQVSIEDALKSPENLERLYSEAHLLRTLRHDNVIRSYASWVDDENKTINMITELFTSGSLRQYRNKHKSADMKAIKNWARQILRGLDYLHTHNPPIIHRDLKCDNIFVNGNHGEVKIGDLGLARIMQQPTAKSVIGTPEFMAPELYEEEYNELVDCYSFGMCLIELITCEYPYSECKNQAQIYKKVSSGIKPAAFAKVKDYQLRQFIEKCLAPANQRLSASELLREPFLLTENPKNNSSDSLQLSVLTPHQSMNSQISDSPSMDVDPTYKIVSSTIYGESMIEASMPVFELRRCNERNEFTLMGTKCGDKLVSFGLRIADYSGHVRNVHFNFHFDFDTSLSIAAEMVEELDLLKDDVAFITELINTLISQLLPFFDCLTESKNSFDGPNEKGAHSEFHSLEKDLGSTSIAKKNSDFIDKNRISVCESLMSSYAGSWITASNDMSLSISSLSLTDRENDLCYDELKGELDAIDMQYQQRCCELLKMRDVAIENAKKKWMMKKISVL